MLTGKQRQLLLYIARYLKQEGVSPSFDEMRDAMALKSKSGVHRLVSGLEERGFIRRLKHRARALEVLRMPEDVTPGGQRGPGGQRTRFDPRVIRGRFGASRIKPDTGTTDAVAIQVPLLGRIAAGTPIEALRYTNREVSVPVDLLGPGEYYCLDVEGDSMVEAGIHDGDTVVIERCDTAGNGAIVVALVEESEVTLKRLRRHNKSVALEPANPAYETRIFGPDQVKVQGRLAALIRRYNRV